MDGSGGREKEHFPLKLKKLKGGVEGGGGGMGGEGGTSVVRAES